MMRHHAPLPHLLRLVGGVVSTALGVVAFAAVLTVLVVFGLGAGVVR
jgi:hypothetical protein